MPSPEQAVREWEVKERERIQKVGQSLLFLGHRKEAVEGLRAVDVLLAANLVFGPWQDTLVVEYLARQAKSAGLLDHNDLNNGRFGREYLAGELLFAVQNGEIQYQLDAGRYTHPDYEVHAQNIVL